MTNIIIVALFLGAACAYVWQRLTKAEKTQVIATARAVGVRVRDMGRALADRADRRRSAYKHLFLNDRGELTPHGSLVLAHLTKFCYAMTTTAQGDKVERDELMRREGRRQVWIMLMAQISASPVDALNAAMADEVVLG